MQTVSLMGCFVLNSENIYAEGSVREDGTRAVGPIRESGLACHSLAMLAHLFRQRELTYQGGFISFSNGRMVVIRKNLARMPRKA